MRSYFFAGLIFFIGLGRAIPSGLSSESDGHQHNLELSSLGNGGSNDNDELSTSFMGMGVKPEILKKPLEISNVDSVSRQHDQEYAETSKLNPTQHYQVKSQPSQSSTSKSRKPNRWPRFIRHLTNWSSDGGITPAGRSISQYKGGYGSRRHDSSKNFGSLSRDSS